MLVAQFQTYCRNLHDEVIELHLSRANERQRALLETLLTRERDLDTRTPRTSVLGRDFGRLGLVVVPAMKDEGAETEEALRRLDVLVDFRNAIGHGNETEIAALVAEGRIKATKTTYRRYRKTLELLAATMDRVVAGKLSDLLDVPVPW